MFKPLCDDRLIPLDRGWTASLERNPFKILYLPRNANRSDEIAAITDFLSIGVSVVPISSFGTNLFLQVLKLPSELLNDETFILAALASAALLYAGFKTRMSMSSVEIKRLTTSSLAHNPTNLLAQNGFSPVDRQSDRHDPGHDLRRGC